MSKKRKKEFEFPDLLLKQISECTRNGFLMFYFNQDGLPQVAAQYDTVDAGLAMNQHATNWCAALNMVNTQMMVQNIISAGGGPKGK